MRARSFRRGPGPRRAAELFRRPAGIGARIRPAGDRARAASGGCGGRVDPQRRQAARRGAQLVVQPAADRKSVVWGKWVSGRVDRGGRRIIKKKKTDKIL